MLNFWKKKEVKIVVMEDAASSDGLHYNDKEANEQGFFFRISGKRCKIMSYKGIAHEVRIPDTINGKPVREIGTRAFAGKAIKSVVFPDGLRRIGMESFANNCELEAVHLPKEILEIRKGAFGGCEKLRTVKLPSEAKRNFEVDWTAFAGTPYINQSEFVCMGHMLLRINLTEGNKRAIQIPRGIVVIKPGAACYEKGEVPLRLINGIYEIWIPSSVKLVEEKAFAGLTYVDAVEIENPTKNYHYVYFAKEAFGKIGEYSPFKTKLVREKLGNILWVNANGWQELKELELIGGTCRWPKVQNIYIPPSKNKEFINCLNFRPWTGKDFGFYLDMQDYYELMQQVGPLREQIQMAKFLAYHTVGKRREEMIQFLQKHINSVVRHALKDNDVELLKFCQHYNLLQAEKGLHKEHTLLRMEEYQNDAAKYLKEKI
ncbi:MAG: leucine-rich repeat domain-containing protein [Lachnospiraceae bacterium]|nr:leucine-rich repeat domain-containing protein [Lachnospiraceae bacterium]